MGRGSSKAGAGSAGSLPPVTNFVAPPSPIQVKKGDVLPTGGVAFNKFEKMTDDEKADVIDKALSTGVPMFLDDSGLQRFTYFTGMSDKPKVVSDSQLDKMKGEELFRTVNDAYNSKKDIGYSSTDIAKQISEGDYTMYSDSGGSAHGRGIYFANNYRDSSYYGSGKNAKTMRAKITGGRSISESQLNSDYNSATRRGDKLALACKKAGGTDGRNLYALAKGYDVIKASGSYRVVLNRRALTVSSTIKNTNYGGNNW